jgi:hypothetical protein
MNIESPMHAVDVASRLLAVALAKPKAKVAWLCPATAIARSRLKEVSSKLEDSGVPFLNTTRVHPQILLRNGSTIDFLPVVDRRQTERLRGLDLDAVAASPWEVGSQLVRDVRLLLVNRGGELI